ncbi:hypothetical protein FD754_010342, partial [Muntiacus muntjak]
SNISSSVIPFSSCPQSFPALGSFLMSRLFASCGQSIGASASASEAIFRLFPRTMVSLLLQLSKLASNVSCVTIQHRCISSTDLAWMVQNNHLSCEASCFHWWVLFCCHQPLSHIVPRKGFSQCFMVHFYRLHFGCYIDWSKGDHHARFENTSLHSTHKDSTNTTNFIHILGGQTQGFVSWVSWCTWLQHVVTIPARNWHKCYCVRVVAHFLNVGADFFDNFLVSLLAVGWLRGIHFINFNNKLFHTQSISQKGMLMGLPILGDTGFKFTNPSSNNQESTVSLGCACNHVFDEVSMSWGIKDGNMVLAGLKFPQAHISGDTTLTFSFQFLQDPGILEEPFPSWQPPSRTFQLFSCRSRHICRSDGQSR